MTVRHLPGRDDEADLTPAQQALTRVRLAAFTALQAGATRHDVDREVAEADRIHLRGISR